MKLLSFLPETVLKQNNRRTMVYFTQSFAHPSRVLDFVTTQPPASGFYYQVTKLGKIAVVLQLRCHLRSSLSSKLGFRVAQKASKSNLKVSVGPRFNEVPKDWGNWFMISKVCYIEGLCHTLHCYWAEKYHLLIYRGLRYIELC